jgi:hypothetical protein
MLQISPPFPPPRSSSKAWSSTISACNWEILEVVMENDET